MNNSVEISELKRKLSGNHTAELIVSIVVLLSNNVGIELVGLVGLIYLWITNHNINKQIKSLEDSNN